MNRGMWLGFIFFIALVVLGFGTLLVKNVSLFGHPVKLNLHFERAQGLRPGSDVRVDGILFGRVDEVALHPQSGVRVVVKLNEPVVLYKDSEIFVESSSVLGGNIISIRRGSRGTPKVLTEELAGKPRPGLEEVGDLASENRENLKQLITNLKDVSQSIKDGQGSVGKLFKSDELHKEAVDTIKEARHSITEVRGEIKKVGDNISDNLKKLTDKLTDKLDNAAGPLGMALNDKKMTEKLDRIITNVEETSKNLKEITDSVKKGDGALGKMVNDKEMGEKLKTTIENVERASESIRNIGTKLETGEGSVGKLLQDDELYQQAMRSLEDIDKFFGRASRAVLELAADYKSYQGTDLSITKIGVRIAPDENKYIYAGGAILGLNREGSILFDKQIKDFENAAVFKPEFMLAYRAPWLFDRHLTVRAGYLEGKPGGGVDFTWNDWGFFSYPVQFTFEARDAYNSVAREDIDEQIAGPLLRAYLRAPLWIRKETWLETLLSTIQLTAGINRIGNRDRELVVGLSVEWPDEDIRTLVGLLGAAR
ncbi:MAG: MCE family protein [Planctomycetes bacterium]|nr:MCE family protein [Planctomycetota bacterium]